MGTTGAQLDRWCRDNVRNFGGVYCADTVPSPYRPSDIAYIINHSPCSSPTGGTHWLACRVRGSRAEWFDSYGLPPDAPLENMLMGSPHDPPPHFYEWLDSMGVTDISYNPRDIQSVYSEVCGLYACYFCKHGSPSKNNPAWAFVSTNVNANDNKIKDLVKIKLG